MSYLFTQYKTTKAIKVVGIHQALDGNMKEQVTALKKKASDWGGKLCRGCAP